MPNITTKKQPHKKVSAGNRFSVYIRYYMHVSIDDLWSRACFHHGILLNMMARGRQAPVPLSIFRSNSKFDENSECSSFEYTRPITTIFCTRHDSDTVVTCAKYRCDRPRIFFVLNFHRISNSIEICLVERAPGHVTPMARYTPNFWDIIRLYVFRNRLHQMAKYDHIEYLYDITSFVHCHEFGCISCEFVNVRCLHFFQENTPQTVCHIQRSV